jgi:hypothetical protein
LLLPCARILSRGKSLLGHGQTKSLTYGRAEPVGNRLSCAETGVCSSRCSHKEGYQIILLKFIIPHYVCRNLFRPCAHAEEIPHYVCRNLFRLLHMRKKFRTTYAEICFGPCTCGRNSALRMPKFISALANANKFRATYAEICFGSCKCE